MRRSNVRIPGAGALLMAGLTLAQAQTQVPAPAAAPAAQPAATSLLTHWGTDFSFLFDGYAEKNFNNPASGWNQLRNFDMRSNTTHFNMGMISIDRAPAPVGFHVDAGFGQMFDVVHSAERAPDATRHFMQAYVSVKPKSWHGVEVDAGEFFTSAGAEVVFANQDWNYSRSLLFTLAIPYYHFGVRASFPVGRHFTGGVQLVQGWNNIKDNNSGKTVGLTGAYAWKKVTWTNTYYGGPEKSHTNSGLRHVYDTVVLVNATDRLSYYVNFDYGRENNPGASAQQWTGLAGAARMALGKRYAVAGRLEFFNDMDGFSTGTPQTVKEATITGEYAVARWLIGRLEFRNDWSNARYFERGASELAKNQPTVLLGLVAYIAPKR